MRKGLAVSLGVGTVAAGTWLAVYRFRRGTPDVDTGTFGNGMGYARLGRGAKSLLWIGGPSIGAPKGLYLRMMTRMLGPFVQDGYTVWIVGQKPDLPSGCTVADMAGDYAGLIAGELDGKVNLLVGDSTGGMIGFCLAALHPGLFGHIAIVVAGYSMTEAAKAANLEFARLLSAGRKTDAAAALVTFLYPGIGVPWVTRLLAAVVARVSFAAVYDPSDVLVTATAVNAFDGRDILPTIAVPVLLVCGDRDRFFATKVCQQTAELIPDCTLKLYEGKDHLGTMFDKRLPPDVLDFVRQPRPARD